jgi:hypothetical protein
VYAQRSHQKLNDAYSTKIKETSLYFWPKVTNPERLYGVKIMKIGAMENLTLGHGS